MPELLNGREIITGNSGEEGYFVKTQKSQHLHTTMLKAETVMNDFIDKSRIIISRVEKEAETAVAQAKKNGFDKGYAEGYKKGYDEKSTEIENKKKPVCDGIELAAKRLSENYKMSCEKNELLEKAFELAEKIIAIELKSGEEAFYGLYRKAALHVSNTESATLKTSARGRRIAEKNMEKFKDAIDGLVNLEVTETGGDGICILETPVGNIDTSAFVQLERAKNIMLPE